VRTDFTPKEVIKSKYFYLVRIKLDYLTFLIILDDTKPNFVDNFIEVIVYNL
jgi:hypothetical protein